MSKNNERPDNLIMKNAQLLGGTYKNFSGAGSKYNPEGKRNFCLILDPETTDALIAEGWNVKFTKPKSDEYEPTPYIKVNVSYLRSVPNIKIITSESKRVTNVTERTVGTLDYAEIVGIDVNIQPVYYDMGENNTGYSAYLKSMNVYIEEDPIGNMFDNGDEYIEE